MTVTDEELLEIGGLVGVLPELINEIVDHRNEKKSRVTIILTDAPGVDGAPHAPFEVDPVVRDNLKWFQEKLDSARGTIRLLQFDVGKLRQERDNYKAIAQQETNAKLTAAREVARLKAANSETAAAGLAALRQAIETTKQFSDAGAATLQALNTVEHLRGLVKRANEFMEVMLDDRGRLYDREAALRLLGELRAAAKEP